MYSVFFGKPCFVKKKLGPENNTTAHIYIYIYVCVCVLCGSKTVPFLNLFCSETVRIMHSKTVRVSFVIDKTSSFTVFPGFLFFCCYYVGASNYVGCRVSDLATWDFAEQKFLELPLPLLALDALSLGLFFGFSGTACPEISVKLVFLERTLSNLDILPDNVVFQKGRFDLFFCCGHFQNHPLT